MLRAGKHKNRWLQASYNKHGESNFIYIVLETICDATKDRLNKREQFWMNALNCIQPNGYNLTPVAGSALGFKHSEETRQAWSKQRKGQKRSEEAKAGIREGWKKRGPVSDETKERMRQAQLGNKHSEETKAKMSAARIGNKRNAGKTRKAPTSAETRLKISEAKKAGYAERRKKALDSASF